MSGFDSVSSSLSQFSNTLITMRQVRLQLETPLTAKSRFANENAILMRENQCLHQPIEYHKLITQDLSTSYEELDIHETCQDFSSPLARSQSGLDDEVHSGDCKAPEQLNQPDRSSPVSSDLKLVLSEFKNIDSSGTLKSVIENDIALKNAIEMSIRAFCWSLFFSPPT